MGAPGLLSFVCFETDNANIDCCVSGLVGSC